MPLGNLVGSGMMTPVGSRLLCQQSSMLMNWYPAAFMPLVAMASAIARMRPSLMLQPKLFQLFQPMGGVRARPLVSARRGQGIIARENSRNQNEKRRRSI